MNPSTSATRWLHYGRIILDAGAAPVTFTNSGRETSLIGLNGRARVTSGGSTCTLGRYDALYIPRDQEISVQPFDEGCNLAELSARVDGQYRASVRVVRANARKTRRCTSARAAPAARAS